MCVLSVCSQHGAVILLIHSLCCDVRQYKKNIDRLQSVMDKMHKKGLTVEQYLSSVVSAVSIAFCVILSISV